MAQLININSTEFRRCNLSAIQSGGTWASIVPDANEIILISTTNSLTAGGSGECDAYIMGDGTTLASALEVKEIKGGGDPELVNAIADELTQTSINGIRYTPNYQWADGTNKTTASKQGSTGRAAIEPISCKVGDTFVMKMKYLGWQQTNAVTAAVVDEDYNILERFHPANETAAAHYVITITATNARYLLINTMANEVGANWYYKDSTLFQYFERDRFRADSFVFNQQNQAVTAEFTKSGTSVIVTFSGNPNIFSTGGKVFKLFPQNATTFQVTIAANSACYVDASLVENSTYASPVYLSATDIVVESTSGKFTLENKIILAVTSNDNSVSAGLFNIGAFGHFYYDGLTKSIGDIAADVDLLKSVVSTDVRSAFPDEPYYGTLLLDKCPNFCRHMREKDKDVCIVLTGTSLTVGHPYTTERANAKELPPLMHTYDMGGNLWEKLSRLWDGQKYRRYDHTDITYTGSWTAMNKLVENGVTIWDDELKFDANTTKNLMTYTTTSSGASVSIQVPADAWQFNFIYRSDSQGGECTIAIAEGNGKMEVYNGTAWVEANGYVLSMLEPAATDTKGDTCFQKRLKMRCKNKETGGINSIGTTKTITITKAANSTRMNVVGFEWSPREFMLTIINGARRLRNWGVGAKSGGNLEYWQDTDVWEFNPDLILMEVTCINWQASNTQGQDPLTYVNDAKRAYFNEFAGMGDTRYESANSIYETSNHFQRCEVVFYGDTLSLANTGTWDADGQPKFFVVTSAAYNCPASQKTNINVGRIKDNFENYDAVDAYMASKSDYIFIPVTRLFKDLCDRYYGSYKAGFTGSGATGATLSIDGTHWNDNGAAFMTRLIAPLFRF